MNIIGKFFCKAKGKLFHIFVRRGPFRPLWKRHIERVNKRLSQVRIKVWEDAKKRRFVCKKDIIDAMAVWYQWDKHSGENMKLQDAVKHIKDLAKRETPKWNNRVIVVVEHTTPRVYKIVSALHRQGAHITLVTTPATMENAPNVNEMVESAVDEKRYCGTVEELIYCLMETDASVIHWFTEWHGMLFSWCAIKAKAIINKKIVIERYDILNGLCLKYDGVNERALEIERYVMENADGICNRSFEIPYLKEKLHFDIRGKVILFHDYVNSSVCPPALPEDDDRELSLVYSAGKVLSHSEFPDNPLACFEEFAEMCRKNKCHVHIYTGLENATKNASLIEMEKNNPYIHLHPSVPFSELINELAKYDYEVLPTLPADPKLEMLGSDTKYKLLYAATNKHFDAVDAGIPILAKIPVKMVEMFTEAGFCIPWDVTEYNFDELRRRRYEMRRHVREHRAEWTMDAHMGELIDFYKSL